MTRLFPLLMLLLTATHASACPEYRGTPKTLWNKFIPEHQSSPVQARIRIVELIKNPLRLPGYEHPEYGRIIESELLTYRIALAEVVEAVRGVLAGQRFYVRYQPHFCGSDPWADVGDMFFVGGKFVEHTFVGAWKPRPLEL